MRNCTTFSSATACSGRTYEAKGEKPIPYSCRHDYTHRAHMIYDLAAYSRWCGDDLVDDAFAKAEQRLGQGLRVQSTAG
jgi:hypothetical protein